MSGRPQRGQYDCRGKVTALHDSQRLPISCGSSAGHVETSGARALGTVLPPVLERCMVAQTYKECNFTRSGARSVGDTYGAEPSSTSVSRSGCVTIALCGASISTVRTRASVAAHSRALA